MARILGNETGDRTQPPLCEICSTDDLPTFHQHFSSLWLRDITGIEDSGRSSLCPSCKRIHPPYPYPRQKMVVSDDLLHMVFAPPDQSVNVIYPGDTIHIDYLTIPGATLNELTFAFRKEYCEKPLERPVDVVLAAGYNDIIQGHSRQQITDSFRHFADTVLELCKNQHSQRNLVSICDLIYPPQLTWLPDDGPLPLNHSGNKLFTFEWLNEIILSMNMDNGVTEFVRLHKFGIRSCTKRRVDQYGQVFQRRVRAHRFEHWCQGEVTTMLHLKNEIRFKIAAAINKYFQLRTSW